MQLPLEKYKTANTLEPFQAETQRFFFIYLSLSFKKLNLEVTIEI